MRSSFALPMVLALLLPAPISLADVTFTVDSTVDAVDANPGDGVCSTIAGECTLRAAVMESSYSDVVSIIVPAGQYALTIPAESLNDAASGDLNFGYCSLPLPSAGSVAVTGTGRDLTIIEGPGITNSSTDLELRDLSIVGGGLARGNCGSGDRSSLLVQGVTFQGGGLFFGSFVDPVPPSLRAPDDGHVTHYVIDSEIRDSPGTGISLAHPFSITVDISNSTIEGNQGGAIFCVDETGVRITNSTIRNNSAVNLDFPGAAGGITLAEYCGAEIYDSTISGNASSATSGAGGIATFYTPPVIRNTTISGNTGIAAGGVLLASVSRGIVLENSTIVGNHAVEGGGGIAGGVPLNWIRASLVAGNTSDAGTPDCSTFPGRPFESLGNNLIGDASGCEVVAAPGDQIGTAESPIDPLVGALGDNGGATQTHALLPGTPALDAIPPADCVYGGDPNLGTPAAPLLNDQRGATRPQGSGCDIGAFEALDVAIDVNPLQSPNLVFLDGLPVPVAIVASEQVDVSQVTSLAFGPLAAAPVQTNYYDVAGDGDLDLVASFSALDAGLAPGDSTACLSGRLGGMAFQSCDTVIVTSGGCGLGVEVAGLLPLLMWLTSRRRRTA